MVGVRAVGGDISVIGEMQGLSFCHVVPFFISGLILYWRAAAPFT